jgi:hypothetical protein
MEKITPELFIRDLKELIKDLPDDTPVLYGDPNFSGPYHIVPCKFDIKVEQVEELDNIKALLIAFPFETPVS